MEKTGCKAFCYSVEEEEEEKEVKQEAGLTEWQGFTPLGSLWSSEIILKIIFESLRALS